MSGRFIALLFLLGLFLVAGLPLNAATPTSGSRATRTLLETYAREEPGVTVKAARPLAEKGNAEAQFILGLFHLIGAGVSIDHVAATTWINQAATQGHTEAQLCLAWQHESGVGVASPDPAVATRWRDRARGTGPGEAYARWFAEIESVAQPNFNRAFLWMLDAAEDGNLLAITNLAQVHLFNLWTQADSVQHLHWLERGVAADDPGCVEQLSLYHTLGILVPADATKGLALRRRAAEAGRPVSQMLLGQQYETGDGVDHDWKQALAWLEKSARQNHVPALHHLLDLRRNGRPGLAPDFKAAVKLAEQGRKLGDPVSTRHLADLYNRGDGVPLNYRKSAELYRVAADLGETNAMTMLGWIYDKGEIGKPDPAEARLWYKKSAGLGNIRAMRELGDMSAGGRGGPVDLAAAFEWYEKAARAGEVYAQEKMGDMLLHGRGVAIDAEEAINWFRLAAANTPSGSLLPRLLPWPVAKLDLVVDGLIAVARETNDPWLQDNLVSVLAAQAPPLIRVALERKVLRVLEEPDLLQSPGILPEACLAALEANPDNASMRQLAVDWLVKLQSAERLQSAHLLGRHAFLGLNMPSDIPRALHWARIAAANTPWKGSLLLAQIESATATDPERRATSWATVRKFAMAGDPEAALLVMDRYVSGQGNEEDLALAIELRQPALHFARQSGQTKLASRLERDLTGVVAGPTEEELAKQTAAILAARRRGTDAAPAVLHRPAPHYPHFLRLANMRGKVRVEFIINADGRVIDSRVLDSDHPLFSEAALFAITQWRFVPGWKDGRAVNVRANQLLEFDPN
jgi:uncharacterized protein